jgi:alpha-amylase
LPDLDQSNSYVANTLYSWIANLTKTFGFDGIRIDTVPEVSQSFWPTFNQRAGVYAVGEVFDGRLDYSASYGKVLDGVLAYPLYFTLKSVFQSRQSMNSLQNFLQQYTSAFKNLDYQGMFIDNHDNPRFLNGQQDQKLYQNAIAYVLLAQGIPIMYYGTEQGYAGGNDPNNREPLWTSGFKTNTDLFQVISKLANYRLSAKLYSYPQVQRYSDDQFYAFTRSTTFVALTNGGSNQAQIMRTITYHPYADGTKLCNLFYPTQDCINVTAGKFNVYLNNGEFKVFYPV